MKLEINSLVENPKTANEVHSELEFSQVSAGEVTQNLKDGIAAAKNGNRSEAKVLLMRVTESDPQNETAWLWLASISEYPEELLVFLQNVLNINPNNERAIEWSKATKSLLSKTFVQRGVTSAHSGNKELAKQSFLQAIVYDGENEMAWLWLASVAEQAEEKLSHLNKVLSLNPNNETAISSMKVVKNQIAQLSLKKANQLAVVGERELANQHLEEVLKYDSNLEEAWLLKAILTDSFDEKATYFNQVLSINPANIAAKAGLASIEAILQAAIAVPDINVEESVEIPAMESNEVELASDEEVFEAVERAFVDPRFGSQSVEETKTEVFEETKPVEVVENQVVEEPQSVETQQVEANEEVIDVEVETIESFSEMDEISLESQPQVEETVEIQSFQNFTQYEEKSDATQEITSLESKIEEFKAAFETKPAEEKIESENNEEVSFSEEVSSFESYEEAAESHNPYKTGELSPEVLATAEVQFNQNAEDIEPEINTFQTVATENQVEVAEFSQPEIFEFQSQVEETQAETIEVEAKTEEVQTEVVEKVEEAKVEEVKVEEVKVVVEEPQIFEQPAELQNYFTENLQSEEVEENETVSGFADSFEETVEPETAEEVSSEMVEASEEVPAFQDFNKSFVQMQFVKCAFCQEDNTHGTAICHSCHSVLNLSDLDMIFDYQKADREKVIQAIKRMESRKNSHEFGANDYSNLALAYLNMQNLKSAYSNLQKAFSLDPTNNSLATQMSQLDSRLSENDKQDAPQEISTDKKIIMVVDDSPTVRKLVSTKLEKCGHIVVAAFDGMDALAKVNETVPDLILLDITMPRLDGYQVCKLIRGNELTKDIPIIMISGKDGFFDKVRGRMAGSSGYITKPFGPDTLMRTLETHLGLGN
jgi:twitching motility two-component system response regulator PilG